MLKSYNSEELLFEEYIPRIIVKFRDRSLFSSYKYNRYRGIDLEPVFATLAAGRLEAIIHRACRRDLSLQLPDLLTYYAISCPGGREEIAEKLKIIDKWGHSIEFRYVESQPVEPPAIEASDDEYSSSQEYLEAAPQGIDAKYGWLKNQIGIPGAAGEGTRLVDVEQGWHVDHEDLVQSDIRALPDEPLNGDRFNRVFGLNADYHTHGTSVLGIIAGADNERGIVGIASQAEVRLVSQRRTQTINSVADAILTASYYLNEGDVLLIEAQTRQADPGQATSERNGPYSPVEYDGAEWAAIRLATALGIVVIEAGGNGSQDVDKLIPSQDSGAIIVGASEWDQKGEIHQRWVAAVNDPVSGSAIGSNYGDRVDCFAWGQRVTTTAYQSPDPPKDYTFAFDGTSSASAIIAGAVLVIQGVARARLRRSLRPDEIRRLLRNHGTESADREKYPIGRMPNLRELMPKIERLKPARRDERGVFPGFMPAVVCAPVCNIAAARACWFPNGGTRPPSGYYPDDAPPVDPPSGYYPDDAPPVDPPSGYYPDDAPPVDPPSWRPRQRIPRRRSRHKKTTE